MIDRSLWVVDRADGVGRVAERLECSGGHGGDGGGDPLGRNSDRAVREATSVAFRCGPQRNVSTTTNLVDDAGRPVANLGIGHGGTPEDPGEVVR